MLQSYKKIKVSDMAPHIHIFKCGENKVVKLSNWMIEWIETSLQSGKINPNDKLPLKGELACHIGVSLGTMQNVYRVLEDRGYIYSKQKQGSFIKAKSENNNCNKLTSIREITIEKIKEHIINNQYKIGDKLISTRKLAQIIGLSATTVRIAINSLITEGVIEQSNKKFIIKSLNFEIKSIAPKTLSVKISDDLRKYINKYCTENEKLPSNQVLAQQFHVSIKTIHDAIKTLAKEGIVIVKRGAYGTIVTKSNKAHDLYLYEKTEGKIKHYILENCTIGSKLPSISGFSKILNVSTKTVKKALDNLAEDGFVTSTRGRTGGTFVTDMPEYLNEAYKWIAINPNYHYK